MREKRTRSCLPPRVSTGSISAAGSRRVSMPSRCRPHPRRVRWPYRREETTPRSSKCSAGSTIRASALQLWRSELCSKRWAGVAGRRLGRSKHLVRLAHDIENGGSLARAVSAAANELKSFVSLHSRAVIDTRPELDPAERDAIESEGFRVLHVPAIAIGSAGANGEIERARSRVGEYDWVVLTSKRGVSALLDGMQLPPSNVRWAAVGATTAKALRDRGVRVDAVPASARGDAIADAMAKLGTLRGSRVLLARADAADEALPQKLITLGAHVYELVAYRPVTAPATSRRALLD